MHLIRTDTGFFRLFPALILFLVIGLPGRALAHRVTIFAWIDGHTVMTQSRFSNGFPVKNGRVTVYDTGNHRLLSGQTDEKGEFSFKLPARTDLRIDLDAGMGHRNEWHLSAADISPSGEQSPAARPPVPVASAPVSPAPATGPLTRQDVKSIIDESIDNKLKPVMKMIAQLRNDQPSVSDILGGLGYIIGLAGMAAYVHARKKG